MEKQKTTSQMKIISICVVLAFLASVSAAALSTPGYVPIFNYLSDLGVGPGAAFFNYGMAATASLLFVLFALSLHSKEPKKEMMGGIAGMAAAVFLACVGIFPEDTGVLHSSVTVLFFSFSSAAVLFIDLASYKTATKASIIVGTIFVILGALFMAAGYPFSPIFENLAVGAFGLWLLEKAFRHRQ